MDSLLHRRANFPSNLEIISSGNHRVVPPVDGRGHTDQTTVSTEDLEAFGIAAKTWEASFELLDYLVPTHAHTQPLGSQQSAQREPTHYHYTPPSPLIQLLAADSPLRLQVLDLGSGTCHLPTGLARRLANHHKIHSNHSLRIIVSDLPEVMPLLQRNISKHTPADQIISARALTWGHTQQTIDLLNSCHLAHRPNTHLIITCSDLVFFPFLFIPLLRSLLILTSPHLLPSSCSPPIVLFGYKERSAVKEFPFFSLLGRYFKLEPILSRSNSTEPWELTRRNRTSKEEEGSKIYLLRATRHQSTTLGQEPLHSNIFNTRVNEEEESNYQHPLLALGDHSASDQWEWILLSNLSDQQLFS